eukprot:CAMPEP_0119030084 /NCGR_PEP_ID=MMETSP1176-20130426/40851_1 /TAXON_ID=265551 /ORGANISM="Synedropsis recta cf, Strain CCMP1620" /LENGTH=690 /DNA_ID=CAMNT_0006986449 /DNA_START=753 /DNA_END=2825 /DNA_ORIENTATION=+
MAPFSDDDEPLIAPTLRGNNSPRSNTSLLPSIGVCTNRIGILLCLGLLVGAGIYYQTEIAELDLQLVREEQKVATLQEISRDHEKVIQRFNNSVTNTDVLVQLQALEHAMTKNQKKLMDDLDTVKLNIDAQLRSTLNELNQTVAVAEAIIHNEVDKVKTDVESYVRTTQDQFSMENSFMIYQLAGTFTLLSCLISMWHMTAHLRKFNQPIVQRKILAILWMCPIYAVTSWVSLVFHDAEGYMAIIKDFYEAYIIYQFLSFCISVLGGADREAVVDLLAQHADHLSPPIRCDALCNTNKYENDNRGLAAAVLLQCQCFAMQFVFFRPLTTIATFVLDKMEYYGPTGNPMDYRSPQVYIIGIQNLSIFIAFTGLLKFYHAVDEELAWCRPFAKFLCIKGVVFMTFWQGLAITILASSTDVGGTDATEWARSAQNFLVCLEMLLFSIAHFYCFPTEEWEEGYKASHTKSQFGDTIALGDFFKDVKLLLLTSNKKKKKKSEDSDSMTTLEEGDEEADDDDDHSQRSSLTAEEEYDEEQAMKAFLNAVGDADEDTNKQLGELVDQILEKTSSSCEPLPPQPDGSPPPLPSTSSDDEEQEADHEEDEEEDRIDSTGTQPVMGQYSGGEETAPSATLPEEENAAPNERTSLLGGGSGASNSTGSIESVEEIRTQNEEMLRPSIFTTVSSVARNSPFK